MGKTVKDQLGRVVETNTVKAPAVILVTPQLGENIGAACRCMLNFGLTDLRLVAPRDGWPNPDAEPMARFCKMPKCLRLRVRRLLT